MFSDVSANEEFLKKNMLDFVKKLSLNMFKKLYSENLKFTFLNYNNELNRIELRPIKTPLGTFLENILISVNFLKLRETDFRLFNNTLDTHFQGKIL